MHLVVNEYLCMQLARRIGLPVGDTFELQEILPYQLAEMCEDCHLPQRQVATALGNLCRSTLKALEGFDFADELQGEEIAFARELLARVRANSVRFLALAKELPKVVV